MGDESDLDKKLRRAKLDPAKVKWTDQIAAGFKNPAERPDYIVERGRQRQAEEEAKKKKGSGPGV